MINNQIDSQNTSAVLKQAIAGAQELDTTTQHLQENRTMKLRFLGQTYSAFNYQVDTVASEHTARFLGQSYTIRRPIQTFKSQLGVRKYRGVIYGAEE